MDTKLFFEAWTRERTGQQTDPQRMARDFERDAHAAGFTPDQIEDDIGIVENAIRETMGLAPPPSPIANDDIR